MPGDQRTGRGRTRRHALARSVPATMAMRQADAVVPCSGVVSPLPGCTRTRFGRDAPGGSGWYHYAGVVWSYGPVHVGTAQPACLCTMATPPRTADPGAPAARVCYRDPGSLAAQHVSFRPERRGLYHCAPARVDPTSYIKTNQQHIAVLHPVLFAFEPQFAQLPGAAQGAAGQQVIVTHDLGANKAACQVRMNRPSRLER